jgi:hypothetical protein
MGVHGSNQQNTHSADRAGSTLQKMEGARCTCTYRPLPHPIRIANAAYQTKPSFAISLPGAEPWQQALHVHGTHTLLFIAISRVFSAGRQNQGTLHQEFGPGLDAIFQVRDHCHGAMLEDKSGPLCMAPSGQHVFRTPIQILNRPSLFHPFKFLVSVEDVCLPPAGLLRSSPPHTSKNNAHAS